MKKLLVLCLVALYLITAPAFAAGPSKTTETQYYDINCDGIDEPVLVETTIKPKNDVVEISYFTEDYVIYLGQEMIVNGYVELDTFVYNDPEYTCA